MSGRFVVTGTDTGIGKTVFAAALAGALKAAYWKPVQAGLEEDGDSETVRRLAGVPVIPEVYRFALSASPHRAAEAEGREINSALLVPPDGPLVIEGAGGLMVPLSRDTLYIDVFARWDLPLILCASTRLGTINHSLLSLAAIRARHIPLAGIAFIGEANDDSEQIICQMGKVRRLGRLPILAPLDGESLRAAFAAGFHLGDNFDLGDLL